MDRNPSQAPNRRSRKSIGKGRASAAVVLGLALALLPAVAGAQVTLTSPQATETGWFGVSIAFVPDLNGDARHDYLVGAPTEPEGSLERAGRVYAFNGRNGALLRTLSSPGAETDGRFGYSLLGVGDLNGDGLGDIVVGARFEDATSADSGRVYVFSGGDGAMLGTIAPPSPDAGGSFGFAMLGLPDVTGDGSADFVVSALSTEQGFEEAGRLFVYNGGDRTLVRTIASPNPVSSGLFGHGFALLDDANGNGAPEILVSALRETAPEIGSGRAYIFDSREGFLLDALQSPAPQPEGQFAFGLARVPDTNGDGAADFLVGAPREDGTHVNSGFVYLYSGADFSLLATLTSPQPEAYGEFGIAVNGLADLDRDGAGEIAVGAHNESDALSRDGLVHLLSGATGAAIGRLASIMPSANGGFGEKLRVLPDADGDGRDEIIVGAFRESAIRPQQGRVYVFEPGAENLDNLLPPENVRAVAGADAVLIEWSPEAVPSVQGYNVYRDDDPEGSFSLRLNASPILNARYTDDFELTRGATYHYRVSTIADSTESALGSPVSATPGSVRAAISEVRAPAASTGYAIVSLDNAAGVVGAGLSVGLRYDPAHLTAVAVHPLPLAAGFQLISNVESPGLVRVAALDAGGRVIAGEGGFFRVEFQVAAGLANGTESPISFDSVELVGTDLAPLSVDFSSASRFVAGPNFVPGDANGNGTVDVADPLLASALAVERRAATGDEMAACDLNGDGAIQAADATLVARLLVGLPIDGAGVAPRVAGPERGVDLFLESDGAFCLDGVLHIPVRIDDPAAFAGFDADFVFDPAVFEALPPLPAGPAASFAADAEASEGLQRFVMSSFADASAAENAVVATLRLRILDDTADLVSVGFPGVELNGERGENLGWTREVSSTGVNLFLSSVACGEATGAFANLSTRGFVGLGDEAMIGGLIVDGTEPRRVLVSGIGPDLAASGVQGSLADPVLALLQGQTLLVANDNWMSAPNAADISDSGFPPNVPLEAAILIDLPPGEYTAVLSGAGATETDMTGVGLVQAFDLGPAPGAGAGGRLRNLSTRLAVGSGDRVMIGGFTISDAPKRVVVRALGPTLGGQPFGVDGAMADPELVLLSGETVLQTNFDWMSGPDATAIMALGLAPPDPREPAVLATLPPGAYTAVVSGAGGTEGVALVEVYEAP